MNYRKKLGMDSADSQHHSDLRGHLQGRLVKQAQPSVEENSKMDMMTMMMLYDDDS